MTSAHPGQCAGLCTETGFAAAYRAHRPRLLAIATSMTRDAQHAEDAVQDAFLRAWSACASFDPHHGPALIGWLITITRNVVIDQARARAVRPRVARVDDVGADLPDRGAGVENVVLRSVLLDALAQVSDEHRAIVLRTVVHDRSYADVAAELGVPVGTVKSRVFYALRGMRAALSAA